MTTVTWRLTALELDVLWDALELGEPPYPLWITSHGETEDERRELRRQAFAELASRLALAHDWADSGLAAALRLLARPRYWIDSLWVADPAERQLFRLRGASDGRRAVLAHQPPDVASGESGDLAVTEVHDAALVAEVVAALPPERQGRAAPNSVRISAFADGQHQRHGADYGYDEGSAGFMRPATAAGNSTERAQRALRDLLDTDHSRGGQIAANARDRMGRRFRSPVVFWFDNPDDGRYVASVRSDRGEDRVAVAPAGYDDLVAEVRQALADVDLERH